MKKILTAIMALMMVVSLAACGDSDSSSKADSILNSTMKIADNSDCRLF